MATYTYSIVGDFLSNYDAGIFSNAIKTSSIAANYKGGSRKGDLVTVKFTVPLTGPEQITLDTIVSSQDPDFDINSFSNNLNKLNATTDPTPDDDLSKGYAIGSKWHNIITEQVCTCIDDTNGAAIWTCIGDEINDLSDVTTTSATGGDYLCYDSQSNMWINDRTPQSFYGTSGATGPEIDIMDPKEGDKWCSDTGICYIYQTGVWNSVPCCGVDCLKVTVCGFEYEFTDIIDGCIEIDTSPLLVKYTNSPTGGTFGPPGITGPTGLLATTSTIPIVVYGVDEETDCVTHIHTCEGWKRVTDCDLNCVATDSGMTGPLNEVDDGVTLSISSAAPTSASTSHILNFLSVNGISATDLRAPDAYTPGFATLDNGDVTVYFNNTVVADLNIDAVDFNKKVLTAYSSRNLNHYQQITSLNQDSTYTLSYDPPIFVTSGEYLLITERDGNNTYGLEAFDMNNNSIGTLTVGPADYFDTGYNTLSGQSISVAVYPSDNIAPAGSLIKSIEISVTMGDGPDGKIFFVTKTPFCRPEF